jgi:hypothetical protein
MRRKTKMMIIGGGIVILSFCAFKFGVFRKSENDFVQVLNKLLVGNEMTIKTESDLKLENVKINIAGSKRNVFEKWKI